VKKNEIVVVVVVVWDFQIPRGADKAAEPEISFLEIGVPLITFCNRIGMTTRKMLGFPLRTNFISGCWSGFSRDKRWVLAGASSSDKKTPAPPMS